MGLIVGNSIVIVGHISNKRVEEVGITLDGITRHLRLFIAFSVEGLELVSIVG